MQVTTIFRQKIFQLCANASFLFIETKSENKEVFLSVFSFEEKKMVLLEQKLDLPPDVVLKGANSDANCWFVEFFQADLPEVGFYHLFSTNGDLLISQKNAPEKVINQLLQAQNYAYQSNFWGEIFDYLTVLGVPKIESAILYLAQKDQIFLFFVSEEKAKFIQLQKENYQVLCEFSGLDFDKCMLLASNENVFLVNSSTNEIFFAPTN